MNIFFNKIYMEKRKEKSKFSYKIRGVLEMSTVHKEKRKSM